MDWIKVLTKHILLEYSDLRDSEFAAWIKIMALTASLEREPTREQILKYVHYKTLNSLQDKLNKHSIDLQYILNKVLIDVQYVSNRREALKQNTQRYRDKHKVVIDDVIITSQIREDKIREDKNNIKKKKVADAPFVLPEWIPKDLWDAYLEVRKNKRAAKTTNALNLVIAELQKIKTIHNQNPIEVLKKSIRSGWSDVYPLKDDGGGNGKRSNPYQSGDKRTTLQTEIDAEVDAITRRRIEREQAASGGGTGRVPLADDVPDFPVREHAGGS